MAKIRKIERLFNLVGYISYITGTTILLLIMGHFLIGLVVYVKNSMHSVSSKEGNVKLVSRDKRESLAIYNIYPDKGKFWEEHSKACDRGTHFEPYFHWRRNGFKGKYINVSDDGVRRTVKPKIVEDAKKIFMFGGSTLWGIGSKDEHTIPSFLQSFFGEDYDVYNYGESGYISALELNYLLYLLANGIIPDAVIFYDGVNDGYAGAYSPAIPRDPYDYRMQMKEVRRDVKHNVIIKLFKASNYKRFIDYIRKKLNFKGSNKLDDWDDKVLPKIDLNSSSVVDVYESHIRQVKALAKEYEFKAFFFWQPILLSGTRHVFPYEDAMIKDESPVLVESQRQVYLKAKKRFSNREAENIFFLGDMFNQTQERIYIDWSHTGPNGNEIIAKRMFSYIKDVL